MPTWLVITILAAAFVASALWIAQRRQRQALAALADSVQAAAAVGRSTATELQDMEMLPIPVARYFAHVLPGLNRNIRFARYEQVGSLRTDARWMHFTARQLIAPAACAFVWDARVSILPFVHVRVRDSLVGGRGAGRVALLSAIPVASAGGRLEMNSGALHRFLAEAVWYPTALFPDADLRWEPIDEVCARATLTHGDIAVSLDFRFNQQGEVVGIYTPGRWGSFGGGYKQVAWEGRFSDYVRRDGVLVPSYGEVGWYLDGEWRAAWRGTVVRAELEFE